MFTWRPEWKRHFILISSDTEYFKRLYNFSFQKWWHPLSIKCGLLPDSGGEDRGTSVVRPRCRGCTDYLHFQVSAHIPNTQTPGEWEVSCGPIWCPGAGGSQRSEAVTHTSCKHSTGRGETRSCSHQLHEPRLLDPLTRGQSFTLPGKCAHIRLFSTSHWAAVH